MAIDISGAVSAYEDREQKRRSANKKRAVRLLLAAVAIGIVRFVVKDPPPPKMADHSDKPFRALPGVLERMPLSEQAKLKPDQLSALRDADRKGRKKSDLAEDAIVKGMYRPADAPAENLKDKALEEDFRYQYVRRQHIVEQKKEQVVQDPTKSTLVRFKTGRYVKVRRTRDVEASLAMELDRTMVASVPKKLILSVTDDALTWVEPVAKGEVRLKPAKGITITVNKNIADRITVIKPIRNES